MLRRLLVLVVSLAALAVAYGATSGRADGASPDELLALYQPVLVLDATERFQPVSVDGFVADADLQRQDESGAWSTAPLPPAGLPVHGGGWRLDRRGCTPAAGLAALDCYGTVDDSSTVYGRYVVVDESIVLQYWLFYDYNFWSLQYPPGPLAWQAHEGDWEVVTVVLGMDRRPLEVAYSQHCRGERRSWEAAPTEGTHPVVHVATGSHANLFAAGTHTISLDCYPTSIRAILEANAIVPRDFAVQQGDVLGAASSRLVRIHDNAPRWLRFPGTWGEAQYVNIPPPLGPGIVPFGASPVGPQQHDVWSEPLATIARYADG